MSSNDEALVLDSLNGDDPPDLPRLYPLAPTTTMYSYSSSDFQTAKPKRRQVRNACTSCQRACKKCDDARPCLRCVKYGVHEECQDSLRKERKKGMKRGPYRKNPNKTTTARVAQGAGSTGKKCDEIRGSTLVNPHSSTPVSPSGSLQSVGTLLPVGYPPPYYAPPHRSPETPIMYPPHQYFVAQVPTVPSHSPPVHLAETQSMPPFQGYYQPTALYHHQTSPYHLLHKPNTHPHQYPIYGNTMLHRMPYEDRNGILPDTSRI